MGNDKVCMFFFARTFALEKLVKGRICGKTSFLGCTSKSTG